MEVRLNIPDGKFKITYMADDQVDLTPADIAGASIIEEEIKNWLLLKFLLKCRWINQDGNNKELLQR